MCNPDLRIQCIEFRKILKKAIYIRQITLFPESPIYELPLDLHQQEEVRRQQQVLENLLVEYDRLITCEGNNE